MLSTESKHVHPLRIPHSAFRIPHSMYIELHCHSAFSFLDGASLPEQLALTASQLGYPALALTDHHGLYGSMAFAQEAKQLGLQAITGAELTLLDGSHVTLLAETPEGYANLCRLITEAHLGRDDRRDPRLEFASLEARHAGLIVLSGCRNGLFPDFHGAERAPAPRALAELCRAPLEERYPAGSLHRGEAERRLAEELRLVERHGLSGFFLVYHDLFDLARQVADDVRRGSRRAQGGLLPGRGRGSSVSSVVCYLLGLSHIDPVATRLFIGRFLNETLASVPDIDLDFPREIREELIRRVYKRYGDDHVGLVCSFPTYRLRSTVREIGKALDLPPGEIEQVAKLSDSRTVGLSDELDRLPGFASRRNAPLWKELCELAEEIAGLPRHVSQHVGGMVISSRPLVEVVPLERAAMADRVVCQWDKDSCDDARFIKIDFLALGMLSLVEECVELVAARQGAPPDLSRIDFDDPAVYDRI